MMRSLMSISEFEDQYGVSRSTIYRLAQKGQIPLVKIGHATRIPVEDADRWYRNLPAAKLVN